MSEYLRKILKTTLLSLALAGAVNAQGHWHGDAQCLWQRGCNNCCEQNCCESSWCSLNRFAVQFEGLYWLATQDNLQFAKKRTAVESTQVECCFPESRSSRSSSSSSSSSSSEHQDRIFKEKIFQKKEELDFKWRPGFRLSVDYLTPCEKWDFSFIWTNLNNHASSSKHAEGRSRAPVYSPTTISSFLSPTFFFDEGFFEFNHIDAHWHLQFNHFEWDIGRNICLSSCFDLHPYIGFKWERFKQKFNIEYLADEDGEYSGHPFGFADQEFKSEFSAFGLQGGFDANYYWGCGLSLFSNVSGGIAYGRVHSHEEIDERVFFVGEVAKIEQKLKNSTHVARPNLDLAIGLRWEHCFCNCYVFALQVAYEYHHYFDQNFFKFARNADPARGDLTFQGVSFGAGISF